MNNNGLRRSGPPTPWFQAVPTKIFPVDGTDYNGQIASLTNAKFAKEVARYAFLCIIWKKRNEMAFNGTPFIPLLIAHDIQTVVFLWFRYKYELGSSDQVKRMLRLSKEDKKQVKEFHRLHEEAAKRGFGHLFRNPSLFEDVVKSLLLCNCGFKRSLEMAEKLCNLQKGLRKRCRNRRRNYFGNFPSAQELALQSKESLETKCNLGYRAATILSLAKDVTNGEINLDDYELEFKEVGDNEGLRLQRLKRIKGFGDFVACNVLMCIGLYQHIPIDSETIRHMKKIHQREECEKNNVKRVVKEIYDKYAPFQTLAYWLELVEYYEKSLGKLSLLESCDYKKVAGSIINSTNL
ncbi:hypothetical protein OSB04_018831 [Centaurea solstitialis]|uniref:Uncharacterized protein n=1 Tax=Centaurea solstitialis TaxID=347529 RepID=A0AA38SWP3_9ASTR|nr:hypothetical protein OSB04_018831 [Centaurea solstitialis]